VNAFDKYRKSIASWCEECNEVFDDLWSANLHHDQKKHKIKITEFWINGKRYSRMA
jgi:hypothetical protein